MFGAAGRVLTQTAAGGATFVQGAALGERAGNSQRLLGVQVVRVHINLHFVRVNLRAGVVQLSIAKKLRAFFAQLLHGGCDGNGQRYGTQNGLRFCIGYGGLNFRRSADRSIYRSADSVQVVADCFAEGVRHWFSFRYALNIRGGCSSALTADGRGSKLLGISASQQRLYAWFFSRSAWAVAK